GALDNGENMVARPKKPALLAERQTLPRPANASLHRFPAGIPGAWVGRTFVQHHRDIGVEVRLDLHRFARPEKNIGSVQVRLERDSLLADLTQLRQTENLEPPAVGQDRLFPSHKPVEPSQVANQLGRWPQVKVV